MARKTEKKPEEKAIDKEYEQLAKELPSYVRQTVTALSKAHRHLTIMFWSSFVLGVLMIGGGIVSIITKPSPTWIPVVFTSLGVLEFVSLLITKTPAKLLISRVIQAQALAIFQGWFDVHDYLNVEMRGIITQSGKGGFAG